MYDIEINGTSYPVKFGMNFIREMNQRVTVSMDAWGGKEENVGLNYYIAKLMDGDLEALQQILFVANKTETPKLNISMLNNWFEDETTDIDAIFKQVTDFLSEANCTKRAYKAIKIAVEEQNQN
jgi:hypothetical protein